MQFICCGHLVVASQPSLSFLVLFVMFLYVLSAVVDNSKMVNGKWLPDFIERLKASAWHQLYLPPLPFTHARSESIKP